MKPTQSYKLEQVVKEYLDSEDPDLGEVCDAVAPTEQQFGNSNKGCADFLETGLELAYQCNCYDPEAKVFYGRVYDQSLSVSFTCYQYGKDENDALQRFNELRALVAASQDS
jgi:hypothetical protein